MNTKAPNLLQASSNPPRCPIPVGGAIVIGLTLRFVYLGSKPLWEDEGFTFMTLVSDSSLLSIAGADPHPFTFYIIARLMAGLMTISDWTFRLPSALLSVGALLLWARTMKVAGLAEHIRRWCILLFAVIPINICYAQEGRAYALAQFGSVLALLAYVSALQRGTRARQCALLAAVTASCLVDGFGLVIPAGILAHALWTAIRNPERTRLLLHVIAGGALAIPYYIFRLTFMISGDGMHNVTPTSENPLFLFASDLVALSPLGITASAIDRFVAPKLAISGLAALVAVPLAAGWRAPIEWCRPEIKWLFLICFALPALVLLMLCWTTGANTLEKRYFVLLAPGFVPVITLGTLWLFQRMPSAVSVILFLVPTLVSLAWLRQPVARSSSDWRTLYAKIASHVGPDDVFVSEQYENFPQFLILPLRAYAWRAGRPIAAEQHFEYRTAATRSGQIVRLANPEDWLDERDRQNLIAAISGSPSGRVWTATSSLARDRVLDLAPHAAVVERFRAPGVAATLWSATSRSTQATLESAP